MNEKRNIDLGPLMRFLEVMPTSGDKELALLKSHLVIEEVLTKIICKKMTNEKCVHDARLSFSQKCNLSKAINSLEHIPWIWHALNLLNRARNELSHNLTPDELNSKLVSFVEHVQAQNIDLFKVGSNEKFSDFHMAAFATYIPLAVHANFDPAKIKIPTILGGGIA